MQASCDVAEYSPHERSAGDDKISIGGGALTRVGDQQTYL